MQHLYREQAFVVASSSTTGARLYEWSSSFRILQRVRGACTIRQPRQLAVRVPRIFVATFHNKYALLSHT